MTSTECAYFLHVYHETMFEDPWFNSASIVTNSEMRTATMFVFLIIDDYKLKWSELWYDVHIKF
jgi:hypothetical protein